MPVFHYCFGFPPFKTASDPTLREANDCVLYLAGNMWKRYGGNFFFGSITYVHNPVYSEEFTISPYDSGANFGKHGAMLGTRAHYYHLMKRHLEVFGETTLGQMFQRWYSPSHPLPQLAQLPYFEMQWFGNAYVPESLLCVLAKFSSNGGGEGIWGTALGTQLRNVMTKTKRVLIWVDGDDSGGIIDPGVGAVDSMTINATDVSSFNAKWTSRITFASLK